MASPKPGSTARGFGLLLAGAVLFFGSPGLTASPSSSPAQEKSESKKESKDESDGESDKETPKKKAAPAAKKKPRVFSNADLAKYAKKSAAPRRAGAQQPKVVAPSIVPAEPVPPGGAPRVTLPADDLENATFVELEARRRELTELLTYLEKKVAWLKNPFLPRPEPPYGEELLDPNLSGGQEYQLSQSRIVAARGRLQKVERLLQSPGRTP